MDTVAIVLQPYDNATYDLPREWIRSALPSSILASALEGDASATQINIPNPDVTPNVMDVLVNLSRNIEPTTHNAEIFQADKYLNLADILVYLPQLDPYYHTIPNRNDPKDWGNSTAMYEIIKNDRIYPYIYMVQKGYKPSIHDMEAAIKSKAANILRLMLADPAAYNNQLFRAAADVGDAKLVKLLLADPRVDPTASTNWAIRFSAERGHPEVVKMLLEDKRVNPGDNQNWAIIKAAVYGHEDIVRMLLADPRVDPTDIDNHAIKMALHNNRKPIVRLLLADPRVRQKLSPADISRYASV